MTASCILTSVAALRCSGTVKHESIRTGNDHSFPESMTTVSALIVTAVTAVTAMTGFFRLLSLFFIF